MRDVIVAHRLGKKFYHYHSDRPWTFQEAFAKGLRRIRPKEIFWGLRNVSFKIPAHQIVGVIGGNGAGKSTLLRLIGGVVRPDEGKLTTMGRIGGFLDLTAGLRPDLTGRENIFVSGVISGLTRLQVKQRFDSIVDFAEVEEFIDCPLRTYSDGMKMRLAFAVAAHTNPDILLIDEVLAVGDMAFQRKCFRRIDQFKNEGCTIIIVSHHPDQIKNLCDKVLWLRSGAVAAYGNANEVIDKYAKEMKAKMKTTISEIQHVTNTSMNIRSYVNKNRFNSNDIKITNVQLLDRAGSPVTELDSGDSLRVEIEYMAYNIIDSPIFLVYISDENQRVCCTTNTKSSGLRISRFQGQGRITLYLERLDLINGWYFVNVEIYKRNWAYSYDAHWNLSRIRIRPTNIKKGVVLPPHKWEVSNGQPIGAEMNV